MALEVEWFVELETKVWNALATGDIDSDRALLADDFVGVYPTGVADRSGHADQLADGPTIASFEIGQPTVLPIAVDAVMLTYCATYRRTSSQPADPPEAMYVSSLWCERDGQWVNVFSQDTPAAPAAPAVPPPR